MQAAAWPRPEPTEREDALARELSGAPIEADTRLAQVISYLRATGHRPGA
jgi:hypothetical protein